jgi:3-phosphoshikimate 1-carboxyvinyltransferase
VSSQFITGLLLALSIIEGESRLTIEGRIESLPYINMTLDSLYEFSAEPERIEENVFLIHGRKKLTSPEKLNTEGDWSNAAFALCAGAICNKSKLSVYGLDPESSQGDKSIIELLVRFGADVRRKGDSFTVRRAPLYGLDIDASNIPDLVPILSVVASCAEGETRIYGAERLRLKESDRLSTTTKMLTALGADVTEAQNGLIIKGGKKLVGGTVSSFGDHRIAMSAAIAALVCDCPVTITEAEAVNKSYPAFFDDLAALGVIINKE